MKLKVDENIGRSSVELLRSAGHDVATVVEQGLGGASDETVFDACRNEGRTLVTLDRDFGHALRFPPEGTAGVVVLEFGGHVTIDLLKQRLRDFLSLAERRPVTGELWTVQPGRIRIRSKPD